MQFSIKRDKLLKSLNFVQGIVEKKNTLPILSNVLLQLKDKKLVDDFLCINGKKSTHVLNAISPAFTASFELADLIIDRSGLMN